MPPIVTDIPATVPLGYMITAILALASAIGVLFWQLIASKRESLDLAKEVIPVAVVLQRTVDALLKLIERLERKLEENSP